MAPLETLAGRPLLAVLTLACCMPMIAGAAGQPRAASQVAAAQVAAAPVLDPVRMAIRTKDFAGAQRLLEQLARGGNADAQYLLGTLLLASPQGDPDPVGAGKWLQQAAGSGNPRAAYMLSVLAATATPVDVPAATHWLEVAAKDGVGPAVELQKLGRLPMSFLPAVDLTEADARAAAFTRAATGNDVATLQRLAAGAGMVNATDAFGRSSLAHAAASDAADSVAWLLGAGAAVDARDQSGATALMLAAGSSRGAALEALLRAGAEVKAVDKAGNTALHFASATDDASRVAKLLASGAALNVANRDGDQPLDIALRADHAAVLASLRAAGATASRPPTDPGSCPG